MPFKTYTKIIRAYPGTDYFYIEYNGTNTSSFFNFGRQNEKRQTDIQLKFTNRNDQRNNYAGDVNQLPFNEWISIGTYGTTLNTSSSIQIFKGEKIYIRTHKGINYGITSEYAERTQLTWQSSGFSIGGNITSLIDYYKMGSGNVSVPDYGLYKLFSYTNYPSDFSIDNVDFSDITSVGNYGMNRMFTSNNRLTTTPDLSNIVTVGEYGMSYMFADCTALTTPPDLSNFTSVGNYVMYYMFKGCSSLTTAPNLSNITSVYEYGMAGMFQGCSSLTTPPDLSNIVTIDGNGMAEMFSDCTSLTTAPDISNIVTVGNGGMQNMFQGCSNLTTAPDLSNITSVGEYGMQNMFRYCSNLNYIKCPNVTTWNTSKFSSWLYTVSETGTFCKPASLTIPTGKDGIPSGWEVTTY